MVEILKEGHYDTELSDKEMERVITWIDIGGPYYPDYASAHPDNVAGRSPLTIQQVKRLGELTSLDFLQSRSNEPSYATHRLWISFDRPELSPCLKKLTVESDAYREALAIIRAGQNELRDNPEADMPGFVSCAEHQAREEKYQRLRTRERDRRSAIAQGRKIYDPGIMRASP